VRIWAPRVRVHRPGGTRRPDRVRAAPPGARRGGV